MATGPGQAVPSFGRAVGHSARAASRSNVPPKPPVPVVVPALPPDPAVPDPPVALVVLLVVDPLLPVLVPADPPLPELPVEGVLLSSPPQCTIAIDAKRSDAQTAAADFIIGFSPVDRMGSLRSN